MKIAVVFVRVVGKPEYDIGAHRWLDSYLRNPAKIPHEVVVIDRYADGNKDFDQIGARRLRYDGGGWDCGSWQFAGREVDADLLVCFNSSSYIVAPEWLERLLEAAVAQPGGIYGPMASLENQPHIRTPCMAFNPALINRYPHQVETREDTYRFESMGWPDGTLSFTMWAKAQGLPTLMVTRSGHYPMHEWRRRPNVFRNGDQSDLLVRDKHADAYEASDQQGRDYLARLADRS